jgi:hypothetical protein
MKKWEHDYNSQLRALEKGAIKGFEGLEDAAVEEVDALKEMEKAKKEIQEREEKKAVTRGAGGGPVAPRMNINVRCSQLVDDYIYFFHSNHFLRHLGKQDEQSGKFKTSIIHHAQASVR